MARPTSSSRHAIATPPNIAAQLRSKFKQLLTNQLISRHAAEKYLVVFIDIYGQDGESLCYIKS
jgi:hypothetical protein